MKAETEIEQRDRSSEFALCLVILRSPGHVYEERHGYYLRRIANKLADERTYMTPSDNAGVAISNSPMEFVARC